MYRSIWLGLPGEAEVGLLFDLGVELSMRLVSQKKQAEGKKGK